VRQLVQHHWQCTDLVGRSGGGWIGVVVKTGNAANAALVDIGIDGKYDFVAAAIEVLSAKRLSQCDWKCTIGGWGAGKIIKIANRLARAKARCALIARQADITRCHFYDLRAAQLIAPNAQRGAERGFACLTQTWIIKTGIRRIRIDRLQRCGKDGRAGAGQRC